MKNLRELFILHHAGFQDFGPWLDHHREMHRRHPLECVEFGVEWLRRWEVVGRLLNAQGKMWYGTEGWPDKRVAWVLWITGGGEFYSIADCIELAEKMRMSRSGLQYMRIALLDGTIIREWGQQNERQGTLYIRGRYPAWRIDARGTVSEMLERGEKRSQAKGLVMYRYAVKVVDSDGGVIKQWDKNRP